MSPVPISVAVIIPVYRARYLAEALESVFVQSHPPDEVIVIDDGSPDHEELNAAVAPHKDRLRLLRQPNEGAGAARNAGIRAASAEFLAFLDADDRWLPAYLETQLWKLRKHPELDVVYTDGMFIGRTPLAGRRLMSAIPSSGPVTLERLMSQRCSVHMSASVVRRSTVIDVGLFDPSLRRGQDFDLWLRVARRNARFAYQRKVLILHRLHEDNLSGSRITQLERPLRVLEKSLQTMVLEPHERRAAEKRVRQLTADLDRERGKQLLLQGDFAAARSALMRAGRGRLEWKVRAALLGLRLAPGLVRWLYATRTQASLAS